MFNLAIDSKLGGCDVVAIKVDDVAAGESTADRASPASSLFAGRRFETDDVRRSRSAGHSEASLQSAASIHRLLVSPPCG